MTELLKGRHVVGGMLSDRRGMRPGYAVVEDGAVVAMGAGGCPEAPDMHGTIATDILNCHTHCADYGLSVPPGLSLEELVAPPDGLKHRYLREAPPSEIEGSMHRFASDSAAYGSESFIDFREGGAEGCRMLRRIAPEAVILGRPTSPSFDPGEIDDILSVADGIGIPSVSDMDAAYIEAVADEVRDRRGIFAIHVSERVREDIDFVLSLDPAFVVHMCEATDDDLLKCAEAEVPVVVCPRSNAYFGKVPPLARAESLGVDLAIGTDNGMLCRPDMMAEADEFVRTMSLQGGDPSTVWRALSRITGRILSLSGHDVGGPGHAVVLPDGCGSLAEAVRLPVRP